MINNPSEKCTGCGGEMKHSESGVGADFFKCTSCDNEIGVPI